MDTCIKVQDGEVQILPLTQILLIIKNRKMKKEYEVIKVHPLNKTDNSVKLLEYKLSTGWKIINATQYCEGGILYVLEK